MHILITGGAGFIGSHLTDALLNRGDSVSVLDNLSTGSIENVQRLQEHPRFSFTHGAIDDGPALDRLASRADAIVHLAAAVGVQLVLERPTHTIETNVLGTHGPFGRGPALRLPYADRQHQRSLRQERSTALLRGRRLDPRSAPTGTRWVYAATKLLDEFLALAAHQEFGLPLTIMRLFNVVGPRQTGRFGMVLAPLCQPGPARPTFNRLR